MKKKSDEYMVVVVVKGENRVNVGKQTFAILQKISLEKWGWQSGVEGFALYIYESAVREVECVVTIGVS